MDSAILNKIIHKFNHQIEIEEKIDKSLIGGMVIKVNNDTSIDGSVKRKLEELEKSLV